jgi:hypothetical protein
MQERIAQSLNDCAEAVRHANPRQIRRVIEATYRQIMNELPEDLLDEEAVMPKIVGYLDVMVLAGGSLGKRADQLLIVKIFGDDASAVTAWLRKRGYVAENEEGAQEITEEGMAFLESSQTEVAPPPRHSGPRGGRRRSGRNG